MLNELTIAAAGGQGCGGEAVQPLGPHSPRRVGPFRLLGILGSGGFGTVYLGRSVAGRLVAVKVVHPHIAVDAEFRQRFGREIDAIAAVGGFYTAPLVSAGPDDDAPWLATAYVPGPSLREAVRDSGPLSPVTLWWVTAGIAEALISIHQAGVTHRDLKPANVLLASDGPRVIDFGIARVVDRAGLTATRAVVGTPAYMPLEQALEMRNAGPAADVYSLGATVLFAATGHPPFPGDNSVAVLTKLVAKADPDLSGLPAQFVPLVLACLQHDPADRPTPAQVLDQVARRLLLDETGPDDRTVTMPTPLVEPGAGRQRTLIEPVGRYAEPDATAPENAVRNDAAPENAAPDVPAHSAPTAILHRAGADLRGVPLSGQRLRGADLREVDLRGEVLQGLDLTDADLRGADLRGAVLRTVTLTGAKLAGANLARARLTECALPTAGLAEARWDYSAVIGALADREQLDALAAAGATVLPGPERPVPAVRPTGEVGCLAVSPSKELAAVGRGPVVEILELPSGAALRVLAGHSGAVRSASFTADGTSLLTGSEDATLRLWNLADGTSRELTGHSRAVHGVAVAPGRGWAVSVSADGTLRRWTLAGRPERAGKAVADGTNVVTLAPDGSAVAWFGSATVNIAEVGPRARFTGARALDWHGDGPVTSVAFAPDGSTVLGSGGDVLWICERSGTLVDQQRLGSPIRSVAFAPDGRRVCAGVADGTVVVATVGELGSAHRLVGHVGPVVGVAFLDDPDHLISVSADGAVRSWDLATGRASVSPARTGSVLGLAVMPSGQVVTASDDRTIRRWSGSSRQIDGWHADVIAVHTRAAHAVAIDPPTGTIASASADRTVRVRDGRSTRRFVLRGHLSAAVSVAVSPGATMVAGGGADGSVRLWQLTGAGRDPAEPVLTLDDRLGPALGVAFSGDGRLLASVARDERTVLVTEIARTVAAASDGEHPRRQLVERQVCLVGHPGRPRAVVFAPGGMLISGAADRTIRLWDYPTALAAAAARVGAGDDPRPVRVAAPAVVLVGHRGPVQALAVSADGTTLASGSVDGTVRLWRLPDGERLMTLRGTPGPVTSVAFTPDGKSVVSAAADGTVRWWNRQNGECRRTALGLPDAGFALFVDDGGYALSGDAGDVLWWVAGRCRFSVGELDGHLPGLARVPVVDD